MKTGASRLYDAVCQQISENGPMSVAQFIEYALFHPELGYYSRHDPLGRSGDFTTAPEISQLFGELIGIWCLDAWLALDKPQSFNLVELGPGRGTLMMDLVKVAKIRPEFLQSVSITLVERNKTLIDTQRFALCDVKNIEWHSNLTSLENRPTIVIANEFLDCLPIHQFVRTGSDWVERGIDIDVGGSLSFTRLNSSEIEIDPALTASLSPKEGEILEVSPERNRVLLELVDLIKANSGYVLLVDYGHVRNGLGDTLQAVQNHKSVDVLHCPGAVDLTSHVNFMDLASSAARNGVTVYGPTTQSSFLSRMGINVRARALSEKASDMQIKDLHVAVDRLMSPDQMGQLFKVLALSFPLARTPAGFVASDRWSLEGYALTHDSSPLSR